MPYASDYNYLTVHWKNYLGETGQFGLKFTGAAVADQAMVDGAATAVQTFWQLSTSNVPNYFGLDYLRLARVGVDGKYLPGSVSFDHTYASGINGGNTSPQIWPLAMAHAVTLRTAIPRGKAHAGRIYLPPLGSSLGGDFLWSTANVNARLNSLAAMLSDLNGSALGTLRVMSKGTVKNPGGLSADVTYINSDIRPDTQRRRAKQQPRVLSAAWNVT